jgi:serine phosphatase RsbU (regulator of sigma subunit)
MLGENEDFFQKWISNISIKSTSSNEFCDEILDSVKKFTGSKEYDDDLTFLVIDFNK